MYEECQLSIFFRVINYVIRILKLTELDVVALSCDFAAFRIQFLSKKSFVPVQNRNKGR